MLPTAVLVFDGQANGGFRPRAIGSGVVWPILAEHNEEGPEELATVLLRLSIGVDFEMFGRCTGRGFPVLGTGNWSSCGIDVIGFVSLSSSLGSVGVSWLAVIGGAERGEVKRGVAGIEVVERREIVEGGEAERRQGVEREKVERTERVERREAARRGEAERGETAGRKANKTSSPSP